jgi:hypothetical protein
VLEFDYFTEGLHYCFRVSLNRKTMEFIDLGYRYRSSLKVELVLKGVRVGFD